MSVPEVSVVVPTRDRWPWLAGGALPSALAQVEVDFEVIVVDDGSTDETAARLAELEGPRLVILRHERGRGLSAARNTGIAAARGEWLAFLDDDDLWAPNKLRAQLDAVRGADAAWVFGGVVLVEEDGGVGEDPQPEPDRLSSELLVRMCIPGGSSNVMARASAVRKVGAYDEEIPLVEDWDLWLRMVSAFGPPAVIPDLLVACSAHGENTYVRARWRDIARSMERLVDKHRSAGLDIDMPRLARWAALQRAARGGNRLEPAWFLLRTGLRHGRPRYVKDAAWALVGRRGSEAKADGGAWREPEWLRTFRAETGWPGRAREALVDAAR